MPCPYYFCNNLSYFIIASKKASLENEKEQTDHRNFQIPDTLEGCFVVSIYSNRYLNLIFFFFSYT